MSSSISTSSRAGTAKLIKKLPSSSSNIQRKTKNQTSKSPRRSRSELEPAAWSFFGAWMLELGVSSWVTLPHHKIDRAQDRHRVAHHVTGQQIRQDAQIHE